VGFLREAATGSKTIDQLAREQGFSPHSFYVWKRKFGAMDKPDVKRFREMEKENARLKRLLAERDVEIDVMKEIIEKNSRRSRSSQARVCVREARRDGVTGVCVALDQSQEAGVRFEEG